MKVHIAHRPGTMLHDIYLLRDLAGKRRIVRVVGRDQWEEEEFDPLEVGDKLEPSLTLDEEVLQALAAAASDVLPPDRAQAEHLKDAIATRDRILDAYLPKADASH